MKHKTVVKKKSVAKPDVKLLSEKKPERKVSPIRETKIVEKTAKPKVPPVLDQKVEKKKVKSQKSKIKPKLKYSIDDEFSTFRSTKTRAGERKTGIET